MLDRRYDSISSDWVHKQYSDARPPKSRTTEVFLILLVVVLLALLGGRLPLPWKASATAQTAARSTIPVWVNQKSGKLEVDNVKIHKVPVQEDGVWTQVPRYTFEGMDFDVTN